MDQQTESEKKSRKLFGVITLSESIILAALPLSAYLISFIYYAGYFDVFRLPTHFISFNLIDVLLAAVGLWGLATLMFGAFNFLFTILTVGSKDIPKPVARRLRPLFPIYFVAAAFFFLYYGSSSDWMIPVIAAIAGSAIVFLPPLFTRRHKGSYLQRMEALDASPQTADPVQGSLMDMAFRQLGYRGFVATVYFGLSLYVAYHAGRSAALQQRDFYVANTSPESVVLYWLNDGAIIAPFDRQAHQLKDSFRIVSIPGDEKLVLLLEQVGPLQPQPTPSSTPTSIAIPTATITIIATPGPLSTP